MELDKIAVTELPLMVQLDNFTVAAGASSSLTLSRPPPSMAELPLTVQLVSVAVAQ